jgi:hypothetical protein
MRWLSYYSGHLAYPSRLVCGMSIFSSLVQMLGRWEVYMFVVSGHLSIGLPTLSPLSTLYLSITNEAGRQGIEVCSQTHPQDF